MEISVRDRMAKRYIVTVPGRKGSGWTNVQIGEVCKSTATLNAAVKQAKSLDIREYTVWTMTYDTYGNKKNLERETFIRAGRSLGKDDLTGRIHVTPSDIPKFPKLE